MTKEGEVIHLAFPPVLDVCCGPRMFWFDHSDPRAIYVDKRREDLVADTREGRREIKIIPDIMADFTMLPFTDDSFSLVIFDPPHQLHNGKNSWMAKKYGTLKCNWRSELKKGFAECFRVLKLKGVLIFKWSDGDFSVGEIIKLAPVAPLIGNRYGRSLKSHWLVFIK